jgi:hypothetical protein
MLFDVVTITLMLRIVRLRRRAVVHTHQILTIVVVVLLGIMLPPSSSQQHSDADDNTTKPPSSLFANFSSHTHPCQLEHGVKYIRMPPIQHNFQTYVRAVSDPATCCNACISWSWPSPAPPSDAESSYGRRAGAAVLHFHFPPTVYAYCFVVAHQKRWIIRTRTSSTTGIIRMDSSYDRMYTYITTGTNTTSPL